MLLNVRPIERVVDLTDPRANRIVGLSLEEARRRVASLMPACGRMRMSA